jgi:hypothetical protein
MIRARLLALFALGVVLLNAPLLSAASRADVAVGGVPVLVAYLFAAWAGLVAACAVVVGRAGRTAPGSPQTPPASAPSASPASALASPAEHDGAARAEGRRG